MQGVPSLASHGDLLKICSKFGKVDEWSVLDKYPHEDFTKVFLIKYEFISNAR